MQPKPLRLLIIGVALFIFGPVLGWVLTILGLFKTVQQPFTGNPLDLAAVIEHYDRTTSYTFLSLIPVLVGSLCAAAGLFLVAYVLIKHFLSQTPEPIQTAPLVPPSPRASPLPKTLNPDAKYMPKA